MAHRGRTRAALVFAHRAMATTIPLDEMLKMRAQALVLHLLARRYMARPSRF